MAKILVVEDNPLNMELATDLLESAGHEVQQAFSAEAGLVLAEREPPHLILMDLRLPGMNGYEALARLKEKESTANIPIVALTAEAMTGDDAEALNAGFDGYLGKPIDTRTFRYEIERMLGRSIGSD